MRRWLLQVRVNILEWSEKLFCASVIKHTKAGAREALIEYGEIAVKEIKKRSV